MGLNGTPFRVQREIIIKFSNLNFFLCDSDIFHSNRENRSINEVQTDSRAIYNPALENNKFGYSVVMVMDDYMISLPHFPGPTQCPLEDIDTCVHPQHRFFLVH